MNNPLQPAAKLISADSKSGKLSDGQEAKHLTDSQSKMEQIKH
jgi:hypothetical protein